MTAGYGEAVTTEEMAAPRPRWLRIAGSFWFHLVLAFVVVGLVLSFVAKPYGVPSESMAQTLQPGDRIVVNRLAYIGTEPATGDVVIFDAGPGWETPPPPNLDPLRATSRWLGEFTGFGPSGSHTLVKRVIGQPGETVACCTDDGLLTVDGMPLEGQYVEEDFAFTPVALDCDTTPASQRCFAPVTVPDDSYLVLGDNRAASSDSAVHCRGEAPQTDCWRWMRRDEIVGKAVVIFWPIARWSSL